MWTLIKQLVFDPTYFRAVSRGTISTIGGIYAAGRFPPALYEMVPWWLGLVVMGLTQAIPAGQTNPPSPSPPPAAGK